MIDSRVRIICLIFLSIAHATSPLKILPVLFLMTILMVVLFWQSFVQGVMVILFSATALAFIAFSIWLFTMDTSFSVFILGYLRLVSLVIMSVVLFLSLDSLHIVTSLFRFRVPVRIAMSLGVGLRFLPVFFDEARRIRLIQRRRGVELSIGSLRRYGFVGFLSRVSTPFLVSVLRRVDSIIISITIQQLEERVKRYQLPSLRLYDWLLILAVLLTTLLSISGTFDSKLHSLLNAR